MTEPLATVDLKAEFLSALANAQRLKVLEALGDREMSVGSLVDAVGISQSALSQHLAKLRASKLVRTRRDAQTIYYSVSSKNAKRVLLMLSEMFLDEPAQRLAG